LYSSIGVRGDLNDATAGLVSFGRHSAIQDCKLIAGIKLDVAGVARACAASAYAGSIGHRDGVCINEYATA
jgi:hypothetical protein